MLPAGRKVLTTAGKILFVLKLLIPGVCLSQESWVAAHGDGGHGATTTPPSRGKRVNLGKALVKEPRGWCHFGTKEVWVNIPSFGSREGVSSCPSVVCLYQDVAVPKHCWKVRIWSGRFVTGRCALEGNNSICS